MNEWFYIHEDFGLCLTFKGAIESGYNEDTLSMASRRGTSSWGIVSHPEHKRKKLIVWSKLSESKQEKVIKRFGDPVEYVRNQPIRDMVVPDPKAEHHYRNRLIEMNVVEVSNYVKTYTKAATWLNMLINAQNNKYFLRTELKLTFEALIKQVCIIIGTDKIKLPQSERKLYARIKEYRETGYECLINPRFGNKHAAKIGKDEDGAYDELLAEKQTACIREAARKHNNFNYQQITGAVNELFELKGWKTFSRTQVTNIIEANAHLVHAGRYGKRSYSNTLAMQVRRSRPIYPLQFFTLDGWTVELGFMDTDGKVKRLVAVIVLDVMNNYPIGYAIGERESAELIRDACRNALLHINELFGAMYQPSQLQSDHFAIKQNTSFFEALSEKFTPAAVGNAKSKVIEPYFNLINKKYCQKLYNWTGHNVDAKKKNQVNREFSDKIKNQFPDKQGVTAQINTIIQKERTLKIEGYVAAWKELPETEKIELSREEKFIAFGRTTGYTNKITGQGLQLTINGKPRVYDTLEPGFRALQYLDWTVTYVEFNLECVLAVSENGHRFFLQETRVVPMDIKRLQPADREHLGNVKTFNKERVQEVIERQVKDAALVSEVLSNCLQLDNEDELALKGMYTYAGQQKEALQDAKGLKPAKKAQKEAEIKRQRENKEWQAMQDERMENNVDFDKYLED